VRFLETSFKDDDQSKTETLPIGLVCAWRTWPTGILVCPSAIFPWRWRMAAEQPGNKALPIAGGMLATMLALLLGLVQPFEGYSAQPYRDVVGKLTVCYGHTANVEQRTYTRAECERLLQSDLGVAWNTVQSCIKVPMTDYQAAALTSFAFNVGPGGAGVKDGLCSLRNGQQPRIRVYANQGRWDLACAQLSNWANAGGKSYKGLERRRTAERAMCEGRY
jgi:lysozyme